MIRFIDESVQAPDAMMTSRIATFSAEPAARADPDDRRDVVLAEQLVDVDRHRRLAHPRALHRDAVALPGAGEAEHPAHLGVARRVVEERLRDPLRPLGIAGQQDDGRDLAGLGSDVGAHGG